MGRISNTSSSGTDHEYITQSKRQGPEEVDTGKVPEFLTGRSPDTQESLPLVPSRSLIWIVSYRWLF